ncbi:MAG: hypothetical protein ACRELC_13500, partial [Gemmatimonadota bacterium]
MRLRRSTPLFPVLGFLLPVVGLPGCGGETPAAPDADVTGAPAASVGGVVASAGGGGNWALGGFDLDGDGVEDPIHQVLGFNAKKFADGSVQGHINYHQRVLGLFFRFSARITCMEIYEGNRVKFGGVITGTNDPTLPPGNFLWIHSIDNGEGEGAPPDLTTGAGFGDEAANEAFCSSPAPPTGTLSEIDG